MRICTACLRELPLDEFPKDQHAKSTQGRRARCRRCTRAEWNRRYYGYRETRLSADERQLATAIKLWHAIETQRMVTVADAAAVIEGGRAVAMRYLKVLEGAGLPIYFDTEHAAYRLVRS